MRWQRDGQNARVESLVRESYAKFSLEPRDRALAMDLSYGVVRNLLNLDHVLSYFVIKTAKGVPPEILNILRLSAYQILYLEKIPHRAAVHEAVEQAKSHKGHGSGGFVNAVLRALIRDLGRVSYPDPDKEPAKFLTLKYSFPDWLAERWLLRWGFDFTRDFMKASNEVPPISIRTNTLKAARGELVAKFEEAGIACELSRFLPDSFNVRGANAVMDFPGFKDGLFAVQDEAAQLISMLVAPVAGERVLDASAAPGGKSTHLASLSGGGAFVAAMDINYDKLRFLKDNTHRLGAERVLPVCADAAAPLPFADSFDGVLLDAPCSALGVIRRRPEIKYSRSESYIYRLAVLQERMLANLSGAVKKGGTLVYATCSVEPDEGERVIETFLAKNPGFYLDDPRPFMPEPVRELIEGNYLRTYPQRDGMDGFFGARLVRR
jgi:16S rRNA (cytosine967-C5)-methyltransferase